MAKEKALSTKFAPAERAPPEEIKRQYELFRNNEVLNKFLSKIPAIFLTVNRNRQVVYMNEGALEFTGLQDLAIVVGMRPGEVFGCVHSQDEEGGCGTSQFCTYCGAVKAVIRSQHGELAMEEARLILGPDELSYDLRVWASPINIDKEEFYAVTIQDISDEKRRSILERVFLHDILNTTSGLQGTVEILLKYGDKVDKEKFLFKIDSLIKTLVDEIQSQQIINLAESKNLTVNITIFKSLDLLNDLIDFYRNQTIGQDKSLKLDENAQNVELSSDQTLLRRIIGNMLKNALEATPKDGLVTLGCSISKENVQFWVHNTAYLPREVQLQIFNRSFSTKGEGRGLGTYSMKLLSSELKGSVTFSTSEEKGTTFIASFPKKLKLD